MNEGNVERRHTDAATKHLLDTLDHTVEQLAKTVGMLQVAFFGRWDEEKNAMVPGQRDQLAKVEERMTHVEQQLLTARRYAYYLIGPALVILVLQALGVPTESLGKLVADFFAHATQ